ncbi:MAG: hypothetical protein EXR71_17810 [Myxococcales bacterium]|nr:hypothetical protein [Myxococcales bacterium]
MTRRARRQTLAFRVVAGGLVLLAALLVGEGFARGLGIVVPAWQARDPGDVIMVGHPTRLWGMGEGKRSNAGTIATINKLGLRGDLPRLPRPAGRERVMVTGDSSFFGHGVGDDATPAALVGAGLRARGLDVDAVNGAVPGYSTEQTRLLLDELGWDTEPTVLVVCNVWSDYNFDHFRDQDLLRTQALFGRGLLAQSALFRLAAGWGDSLRGGGGAHVVTWTQHSTWPTSGVRRVSPQRFAENLDAIARDAAARGVGIAFLRPTNRDMARGDDTGADVRAPYFDGQAAVAAWHGVPLLQTGPALAVAAAELGPDALFLDDLHPSAAGNAVVAGAIVDGLLAAGWPTSRLLARRESFDASAVADSVPDGGGASPGSMSPQVNLFPAGNRALAAAEFSEASNVTTGRDQTAAWTLAGTAHAPPGPVEVTVRGLDDEKLGAVVLRGQTSYRFEIPFGHARVRVEVMASAGRAIQEATPTSGELRLDIRP